MEETTSWLPISLNIWGHSPIQVNYCIKQSLSALRTILKTIQMSFWTMVYHFICKTKILMCLLSCNCRCFMYYSIDTMFTYSFVKRIYYGQKYEKYSGSNFKYCSVNNYAFRTHQNKVIWQKFMIYCNKVKKRIKKEQPPTLIYLMQCALPVWGKVPGVSGGGKAFLRAPTETKILFYDEFFTVTK